MEKVLTSIVMLEVDRPLLVGVSGTEATLSAALCIFSISKLFLIEGRKERKERGREGRGRE